jgi:hypothetical protein
MAKKQNTNTRPANVNRPQQPNANAYQQPTGGAHNPGEPVSTWQNPQNAQDARAHERSIGPAWGAGSAAIGSPEQARGNPPGVRRDLPSGATGVAPERKKGK